MAKRIVSILSTIKWTAKIRVSTTYIYIRMVDTIIAGMYQESPSGSGLAGLDTLR